MADEPAQGLRLGPVLLWCGVVVLAVAIIAALHIGSQVEIPPGALD